MRAALAADFGDVTAPLLVIGAGALVTLVALGVDLRRTLRARAPSVSAWAGDRRAAVTGWVAAADARLEARGGDGTDVPLPNDDLHEAIRACPDRRRRRDLTELARTGRLAVRRADKGRRPGRDERAYVGLRDRVLEELEQVALSDEPQSEPAP